MSSKRPKRVRLTEGEEPAAPAPPEATPGGPTLHLLHSDVLLEACSFLSLPDVHSAALACTAFRRSLWQSLPLWEGLLARRHPSLSALGGGWCRGGRAELLRRVARMRLQYGSVREVGLPPPLQGKAGGAALALRWRPTAVVFLLEVWSGRREGEFDDDRSDLIDSDDEDCGGEAPVRRKQELLFATSWRIPAASGGADSGREESLESDNVSMYEEVQIPRQEEERRDLLEKVLDEMKAAKPREHDAARLYVEMSYYVEGPNVPKCDPIVLLSEHRSFFSSAWCHQAGFRTDVEECWSGSTNKYGHHYEGENRRGEERYKFHRKAFVQIARYGNAPFPFDPDVSICISPPGAKTFVNEGYDYPFENDTPNDFSLHVEASFSRGETYMYDSEGLHFGKEVVLPLLSLWNDAARYSEKMFSHHRCCGNLSP